jgi:hypothetical protein
MQIINEDHNYNFKNNICRRIVGALRERDLTFLKSLMRG